MRFHYKMRYNFWRIFILFFITIKSTKKGKMSEEGREYLGCLEAAIKNNAYRVKNCKKVLEKLREEIERIQNSVKLIQQESE